MWAFCIRLSCRGPQEAVGVLEAPLAGIVEMGGTPRSAGSNSCRVGQPVSRRQVLQVARGLGKKCNS